jgi:Holliday junction DNA helicase RuvA
MIGWLQGDIIDALEPGKLVLNVQGVGYDVETSLNSFFQLQAYPKEQVALHIHTIVREDALLLYGFLEREERALFRSLIKISGIGPKVAMAILSSITPSEFVQCIRQENAALLTKLPGIGKKTAERLLIEMRDSIKQLGGSLPPKEVLMRSQDEAISALETLGYKPQEAARVVTKIDDGLKTPQQLIREALQVLASH